MGEGAFLNRELSEEEMDRIAVKNVDAIAR